MLTCTLVVASAVSYKRVTFPVTSEVQKILPFKLLRNVELGSKKRIFY